MKKGVVVLNFARDVLVNEEDMIDALESGQVKHYVSDFPTPVIGRCEGGHRDPAPGRVHWRSRRTTAP